MLPTSRRPTLESCLQAGRAADEGVVAGLPSVLPFSFLVFGFPMSTEHLPVYNALYEISNNRRFLLEKGAFIGKWTGAV